MHRGKDQSKPDLKADKGRPRHHWGVNMYHASMGCQNDSLCQVPGVADLFGLDGRSLSPTEEFQGQIIMCNMTYMNF